MLKALTARVVYAGEAFWATDRLRRVKRGEIAVVCEGCDWYVVRPEAKFGSDHMDRLRCQHLEWVHHNDLVSGRMMWRRPREGVPG